MKKISSSALIFVLALITSCDPAKTLFIKNKTGKDASIKIFQKSQIEYSGNKFFSNKSDTIEYSLTSSGNNSQIWYLYGFGIWSKNDLNEMHQSIKEIQIISKSDTTRLKSKEELNTILPRKRFGLLNNYLKIIIK